MNCYSDKTDIELIHKSKAGNPHATTYLMNKYEKIVLIKAKRYSYSLNDTDDFIQEGLIALYEAINNYKVDKETSFSTFIEVCIDHRMTSYIRKQTSEKVKLLSNAISIHDTALEIPSLIISSNKLPENILLKKSKSIKLQRCITQKLTDQEAEVIRAYLLDESLLTISKKINLSYKSVDNTMQRAIKKLRKCIEN